jgi:hypothetical protein
MNRLRRFVLPVIAVAALSTSACSGSAGDDNASGANPAMAADGQADSLRAPVANAPAGTDFTTGESVHLSDAAKEQATQDRAVIQTGSVSLRSDDVAKARFELDKLLAKYDGLVDNERTVTDKEGEVRMSQLVVRVPASYFDETMNGLTRLGTLVESTRKAKDVTTQVIDTDVRIRAQEESLSRVETLLARANSIRDIMAIEAQLTRRQADLDALKETRAFLSDQTEMSTVTVFIERTDVSPEPVGPTKHHNAFVAGLISGWDAFTDIGAGLAKAGGAVLPFAALLALFAWPLLLVGRRLAAWSRRTTTAAAPTEA